MASPVVWFQITGQDGEGLRTFYSELLGWSFDQQEYADYGFVAGHEQGIPGGVGRAENGPAGVTFYVGVDDQAAALAKAERLGGRAVMPPTPLPNGTTIAFFADPEGNVVGLSGGGTPADRREETATVVRALNDALNARDREGTAALFASDGVFRPGAAGACFEGPEAIADALFGFLGAHRSGQFETVHELFAGDEAHVEWEWAGVTNEGVPAESHGCDHYRIRDGKVAVKNTFRKV